MKKLLIWCLLSYSGVVFSMDANQFLEDNNISAVFNTFTNRTDNQIEIQDRNEQILLVIPPQSSFQWNEPVEFNKIFNFGQTFFINSENYLKITGWLNNNSSVLVLIGIELQQGQVQEVTAAMRQLATIENEIDLNSSTKQQSNKYAINVLFGETREDSLIDIYGMPHAYEASVIE